MTKPPAMPELNPADIVVEIVRKPMGGFAYVNTSGVTVTHKPSGIGVTVDSARSQHINRQSALDKLRSTLAALQPKPAAVSDAQIMGCIAEHEVYQGRPGALLHFARAILALRPQAVPMTDERLAEVLTTAYGSPEWTMDDVRAARAVEAEAIGITQRADGGEVE